MITASTVNISAINASLLYTTIDNVSVNKTLTIVGDDAATQKWTKSNTTFAYVSSSCYIGLNSQLGNNWLSFYANNTVADAQINCNNGTTDVINSGVLNYNAAKHVFNGKIQATSIIAPSNTLSLSYYNPGNHLEVSTKLDTGTIIDFHSNPAATDSQYVDYDSRILSIGGTTNTPGNGTMKYIAGSHNFNNTLNASLIMSAYTGYLMVRIFYDSKPSTKFLINNFNNYGTQTNTSKLTRIHGFILSKFQGTNMFSLLVDDWARLYINDTLVAYGTTDSGGNGSIQLNSNTWYPIMLEYYEGAGSNWLNFYYYNYNNFTWTVMAHTPGVIEFAYDDSEAMITRFPSCTVNGTLTANGNINMGSNTLTCNEITLNGATLSTTYAKLNTPTFTGLSTFNGNVTLNSNTLTCGDITLNGSTVSTTYAKLYAPTFTGTPSIAGSNIVKMSDLPSFNFTGTPTISNSAILKVSDLGSLSANIVTTGNITANNAYITTNVYAGYSDDRLKTDKYPLSNVLRVLPNLSTFNYYPNTSFCQNLGIETKNEREIGMSAQEVLTYFPEVVCPAPCDVKEDELSGETCSRTGLDLLTIRYERLVPVLFQAIRELNEKIERLEKRVMFLELK